MVGPLKGQNRGNKKRIHTDALALCGGNLAGVVAAKIQQFITQSQDLSCKLIINVGKMVANHLLSVLFPHLAAIAFFAISFLRSGVNASALALPPFSPPNRPNSTAAGFFWLAGSVISPVAMSTIIFANWFGSLGLRAIS